MGRRGPPSLLAEQSSARARASPPRPRGRATERLWTLTPPAAEPELPAVGDRARRAPCESSSTSRRRRSTTPCVAIRRHDGLPAGARRRPTERSRTAGAATAQVRRVAQVEARDGLRDRVARGRSGRRGGRRARAGPSRPDVYSATIARPRPYGGSNGTRSPAVERDPRVDVTEPSRVSRRRSRSRPSRPRRRGRAGAWSRRLADRAANQSRQLVPPSSECHAAAAVALVEPLRAAARGTAPPSPRP